MVEVMSQPHSSANLGGPHGGMVNRSSVEISIEGNKNLTNSDLIMRNLLITAGIGSGHKRQSGSDLKLMGINFEITNSLEDLTILIQNRQTNTLMYVRCIPLKPVMEFCRQINGPFRGWVPVYAPGDPSNQRFDPRIPADEHDPQICLGISFRDPYFELSGPLVGNGMSPQQMGGMPGQMDSPKNYNTATPGYEQPSQQMGMPPQQMVHGVALGMGSSGSGNLQPGQMPGSGNLVGSGSGYASGHRELPFGPPLAQSGGNSPSQNRSTRPPVGAPPQTTPGNMNQEVSRNRDSGRNNNQDSSPAKKPHIDADVIEVKWMASHIQRQMASQQSAQQNLLRLQKENARLKEELVAAKQDSAMGAEEANRDRSYLDIARRDREEAQKEAQDLKNILDNKEQEIIAVKREQQRQQDFLNAQVSAAHKKLGEMERELASERGGRRESSQELSRLESVCREQNLKLEEIKIAKKSQEDIIEKLRAELRSTTLQTEDKHREAIEKLKREFQEKLSIAENQHLMNQTELQKSQQLEKHLQELNGRLEAIQHTKIELESEIDMWRAKHQVAEKKIGDAKQQAQANLQEQLMQQTIQMQQQSTRDQDAKERMVRAQCDAEIKRIKLELERKEEETRNLLQQKLAASNHELNQQKAIFMTEKSQLDGTVREKSDELERALKDIESQRRLVATKESEISHLKNQAAETLEQTKKNLLDGTEREKRKLEEDISKWQHMFNELQSRLETDKAQSNERYSAELVAKREEMDKLYKKYEDKSLEFSNLEALLSNERMMLQDEKLKCDQYFQKVNDLENTRSVLEGDRSTLEKERENLRNELKEKDRLYAEEERARKEANEKLGALTVEWDQKTRELEAKLTLSELEKASEAQKQESLESEIRALENTLNTKQQEMSSEKNRMEQGLSELTVERDFLKEELNTLRTRFTHHETEVKSQLEQYKDYSTLQAELATLKGKIPLLEQEKADILALKDKLSEKVVSQDAEISSFTIHIDQLEEGNREITKIADNRRSKIDELESQIRELQNEAHNTQQLNVGELAKRDGLIRQLEHEKEGLQADQAELETQKNLLGRKLEELQSEARRRDAEQMMQRGGGMKSARGVPLEMSDLQDKVTKLEEAVTQKNVIVQMKDDELDLAHTQNAELLATLEYGDKKLTEWGEQLEQQYDLMISITGNPAAQPTPIAPNTSASNLERVRTIITAARFQRLEEQEGGVAGGLVIQQLAGLQDGGAGTTSDLHMIPYNSSMGSPTSPMRQPHPMQMTGVSDLTDRDAPIPNQIRYGSNQMNQTVYSSNQMGYQSQGMIPQSTGILGNVGSVGLGSFGLRPMRIGIGSQGTMAGQGYGSQPINNTMIPGNAILSKS